MKKVSIIGCPGSGKSTFARGLRDKTGLPLYYLDMIWHNPDRSTVSREEFDLRLEEILSRDEFIIDGNYNRTLERRFISCDTIFFMNIPTEICIESAKERIGKKREDLPWVETEFDSNFEEWILNFPKNGLPIINDLIKKYSQEKNIIIFNNRQESENYLKETRNKNV